MKYRLTAPFRVIGLVVIAAVIAVPAMASDPQGGAPTVSAGSSGILFVDVTPDTITTLKTAQNLITRVALPQEAKQAICGDLFDPATNTGSFVIDHNGNDVFIKPVAKSGQTNLFVKTDTAVYNFDLVVVPPAQAYRVVNVNLPPYEQQIAAQKAAAAREIEQQRTQLETDMAQELATRKTELDQKAQADLAAEQKRLRTDADRRAADMATRRFIDGILQGLSTIPLREKRGQYDQIEVVVDDSAYVFEGKLYVRFRLTNRGTKDVTYQEPKLLVQGGEKDRPVTTTLFTSRGDYKVPAGQSAAGIAVFERPSLDKGERIVLIVRGGGDRVVQLRLLEQS
jgi:hypothetical protein